MHIKKGDTVKIMAGKDKGKSGKVTKVFYKINSALVEGLNLFKKHQRPRKQGEKGEIINVMRPLNLSKMRLVCPNCKKAVRTGYRIEGSSDNKRKFRICKKCGNII